MKTMYKVMIIGLILPFFLENCANPQEKNFYKDIYLEDDVLRVPVVEPYEFIAIDTAAIWGLHWPKDTSFNYLTEHYNADSVNYRSGKIMLYNTNDSHLTFGIIDIKKKTIVKFQNRDDFNSYLSSDTLLRKLHAVKDVFNLYKKNGTLPWDDEIKK